MGKFNKHLGQATEFEIEGEKFVLKPLTIEDLPDYFGAMKAFQGVSEDSSTEEMLSKMNPEGLKALAKLLQKVMAKSYPDEPQEERDAWAMKNMPLLITKVFEMNTPAVQEKQSEQIKKLKKE